MSVTTAIENISNHLKNAYDELQGLGADLTNVNKNIENISMVLDDIYDSMPQVSGEGTSLTLDDTRVGKIKSTLKGNTSQTGIPTPTSPIPISVVSRDNTITISNQDGTDSNTYNIDLPVENLFDKDNANYVNGWIDGTTMRLNTINGNRMFYIPCKPNTTYTISRSVITSSFRTTTYDNTPFPTVTSSNVNYTVPTVIQNNSGTTLTITTNANAKYLIVHYGKIEDTNLNETLATIQVEYGSKKNTFTPHGITPIELCKIGDYQDYFYKDSDKWYLHKEVGKKVFDGTEVGGQMVDNNQRIMFSSQNVPALLNVYINEADSIANLTPSLCDHFQASSQNGLTPSNTKFAFSKWGETTYIYFSAIFNNAGDFKTWLSTHNIIVYYALKEPTITEITYQPLIDQLNELEKATSKKNQTNINQVNNDLPFVIKANALLQISD